MASPELAAARTEALRRGSRSLAAFFDEDEESRALVAGEEGLPDPAGYRAIVAAAAEAEGFAGIRLVKRRRLLELAARDLAGECSLEEVGAALAAIADACLQATLERVGESPGLVVIAMGKHGGTELNYSSDIDIVFVAEDPQPATKVVERVVAELGGPSPQGQAYRIDLALRPEGKNGPLVRSPASYAEYYRRWAQPWEHQALIKARPAAGDTRAGFALLDEISTLVYEESVSPERIASIRKMKERVESHATRVARRVRSDDVLDVKLGPGGIRDIEFSVQLLQLVHGGSDPSVRHVNNLAALNSLVQGGYIAEDDGAGLAVAYRWLRTVEHRLQLWQERQVHHLPAASEERALVARVMGFRDSPAASGLERFDAAHRAVLTDVRGRFEKLFYRPMIDSLADTGRTRLAPEALEDRLRVLGFRDVKRAATILNDLVQGTTRRARLFRVITPALLRFLASTPQPDEGLFSFLRLAESLENRLDVLGALRDNPPGIALAARVLGAGRVIGDLLVHVPEELGALADPRGPERPKARDRLVREGHASLDWRAPETRLDGLRRFKRREMLRIAVADVAGVIGPEEPGPALSDLAEACLEAALGEETRGFAVIAMGKFGGRELGYPSDIDVMFVHDRDPGDAEKAAEALLRAIGEVTPEGQAFRIDPALRPEGKAGPLARSLDSYREYYQRWAKPWEHQALIKARGAAGDPALGDAFVRETRSLAFPARPAQDAIAEIRHLKARMERERIPRGTDPRRNLKLGPGGMSDVEFAAQILQIQHAHSHPALQVSGTLAALEAAADASLIAAADLELLRGAYWFLDRIRNRLFFIAGRPVDVLPDKPEVVEALGIAMGYEEQPRQEVEEAYLRNTRRVRAIAEHVIYG